MLGHANLTARNQSSTLIHHLKLEESIKSELLTEVKY